MSKQATTRRWTKVILIACGVVLVLFVGIYTWQTQRPTGYGKLSVPSPVDAKPRHKAPPAPRTTTPPAQTPIASASAPPANPKISPLLEQNPPPHWNTLAWFGGGYWSLCYHLSTGAVDANPSQIFDYSRAHSPYLFRNFRLRLLSPSVVKDLRDFEARIWAGDWPQPTTEAYYGRGTGEYVLPYWMPSRVVAMTAMLAASRGDTAEANARMLAIIDQDVRINQVSLGRSGEGLMEYLFMLDAMDALSSDTLSRAIAILDDGMLTEEEFVDQRRASIRAATDACLDRMDSWPSTKNTFSYMLDGVPDSALRRFMVPAVRNAYEQYAVAVSDMNLAAIETAEGELNIKIEMMNRRHSPYLEQLFAARDEAFWGRPVYNPYFTPPFSSDPIKELYQDSVRQIMAQRFAAACLQFKMEKGDWPRDVDDLKVRYLPPGFIAQTECDWVIMKPEPFEVCSPDPQNQADMVSLYFEKNRKLPTNSRQLANFFQSADEEPFKALFQTIRPQFMFASVRRCGQVEMREFELQPDGQLTPVQKQRDLSQTIFFLFPEKEVIRERFSQLRRTE